MPGMDKHRFSLSTLAVGSLAGFGLAMAVFTGGFSQAAPTLDEHDNEKLQIATYEPQLAFQQYHGMQEFNLQMQRVQQQMQEAQQQGDQQRLVQLQQEMQELQNQVVEQFYNEVQEVIPQIVEDTGVKVVAIEIVYASDEFAEPKDITDRLIRKVNEEAGADAEPEPDLPW
jgi:hypothetical protein